MGIKLKKDETDQPFLTRTYPTTSVSIKRGGFWYVYWIEITNWQEPACLVIEDENGYHKAVNKVVLKLCPENVAELKAVVEEIEKNNIMWKEMDPQLRKPMNFSIDPELERRLKEGEGEEDS